MKRIALTMLALAACAHETESGAPGPVVPAAPAAGARGAAPAPAPRRDSRFAPVQQGQQPVDETQSADRALRSGNYERAIQDAKRALLRNERYVPAIVILAKSYCHLKKYELCGASLDTAAQIDDRNAEVYFVRGQLALARDDKPAAVAAFQAATERNPGHGTAWNNLAALYLMAHNFEQAQAASKRALQVMPGSVKAQMNLGSALRGLKQYHDAEAAYRHALQMAPNNPDAYFNLGILYLDADPFPGLETMGRLDQAISQLQRYKQVASYRLTKDDPVDQYIDEAQKAKERERKKVERMKKEAQRVQPKPGQPSTPNSAPQPAPAAGGKPK